MSQIPTREQILAYINRPDYKLSSASKLRAVFSVTKRQKDGLKKILEGMVRDGLLVKNKRKEYRLADRDGVTAPQPQRRHKEEKVVREKATFTRFDAMLKGVLFKKGSRWWVRVDDFEAHPIHPEYKKPGEVGDILSFELLRAKRGREFAKPVETLGNTSQWGEVTTQFLKTRDLPESYPADVVAETDSIGEPDAKSVRGREDFREVYTACIDPEGARDHDDAISLRKLDNGNWELGVHIADVSHYVTEGSALDKEALARAFTQYLPWCSVPMIPEKLSSDICSLREGVDRLAFSCIAEVTVRGAIEKYRFAKTIVNINESLSYEQAELMGQKTHVHMKALSKLTSTLKVRRIKEGFLLMNLTERRIKFDEMGIPCGVEEAKHLDSHSWIEECMLLANRCCAKFLQENNLSGIYRVHESPAFDDVEELLRIEPKLVKDYGVPLGKIKKLWKDDGNVQPEVFSLYEHMSKEADGESVVIYKVLRSMKKARYAPTPDGHFALNWQDYLHFTSPIRRYADLWVHRQIADFLSHQKTGTAALETRASEISESISAAEIGNMKNERAAKKCCMAWILMDKVGDEFLGSISGLTDFGMFVELDDLGAEGLVRYQNVPGDFFIFDPDKKIAVGKRNGAVYQMGDRVRIEVLKANPMKGEVDFEVIERLRDTTSRFTRKKRS
ncbi:MAG: RNB domain-containing ribonuclease [Fibrobacterales bacterium]